MEDSIFIVLGVCEWNTVVFSGVPIEHVPPHFGIGFLPAFGTLAEAKQYFPNHDVLELRRNRSPINTESLPDISFLEG